MEKQTLTEKPKWIANLEKVAKGFNFFITILFVILIIINSTMFVKSIINKKAVPDFLGYKFFIILTGSMESTLYPNDFIVTKDVDEKDLKEGDIISFKKGQNVVTHRIKKIHQINGKTSYVTRGDNNNTDDEENITIEQIEGRYVFKISKIGKLLNFLRSTLGIIILILMPVVFTNLLSKMDRKDLEIKTKRKEKRIRHEIEKK